MPTQREMPPAVTLVPVTPEHAGAVQRLATSHPAIAQQTRLPVPYPEGGAADWIAYARPRHARGEEYSFAVLDTGGAVVGACGLVLSEDRQEAELGYWIGQPYWGRGYATAAARQALCFAFDEAGVRRAVALPLKENAASRRVLEKAGMRLVRLRDAKPGWPPGTQQAEYEAVRGG